MQFQSSTQATIYQMTAMTASFITVLAAITLLTTQKMIATTNPLPIRACKRLAIRRTMGVCMLALGLIGVARSFFSYKGIGLMGYTAISSSTLVLYTYIGLTILVSRYARTEIAVGNVAMTLMFPALWLCTESGTKTHDVVENAYFYYLSLQIGAYAAIFFAEWQKCKRAERRRYAAVVIIPALAFGVWSAIGWVIPSGTVAIIFMAISTSYMLLITSILTANIEFHDKFT